MSLFRRAGALISRYLNSAVDPAAAPVEFKVYAKDGGGGITQLFGRSSDGTVYPLSPLANTMSLVDLSVSGGAAFNAMVLFRGEFSPPAITGNNDDYGPAGINVFSVMRQDLTAAAVLTGMFPTPRQILIIHNISPTFTLTLNHEDVASTAEFRFFLPGNIPYAITPNGSATLRYDDTSARWRLTSL